MRGGKLWHSARMRIVCPICSAAYEVRDALLAPGRTVRCARCGEQWVAIPATEAAPAPPEAADEPASPIPPHQPPAAPPRLTAMDRLTSQPASLPHTGFGLPAAWAASLVVLLLFGWGLVAWRADLMRVWPPSTRLYDAIGLTPATPPGR
ncbi:MAG: zinc-ribbon domain-containing protein [Acetobacteraceae bacterium]|jgi:predicted Zn finger-like uncharacterized protein